MHTQPWPGGLRASTPKVIKKLSGKSEATSQRYPPGSSRSVAVVLALPPTLPCLAAALFVHPSHKQEDNLVRIASGAQSFRSVAEHRRLRTATSYASNHQNKCASQQGNLLQLSPCCGSLQSWCVRPYVLCLSMCIYIIYTHTHTSLFFFFRGMRRSMQAPPSPKRLEALPMRALPGFGWTRLVSLISRVDFRQALSSALRAASF